MRTYVEADVVEKWQEGALFDVVKESSNLLPLLLACLVPRVLLVLLFRNIFTLVFFCKVTCHSPMSKILQGTFYL